MNPSKGVSFSGLQLTPQAGQAFRYSNVNRFLELDVLRCLAVVLVLFNHACPPFEHVPAFLQRFSEITRRGGWIGVDLFFVLSGFLISGLLFREYLQYGRISFKRFFVRRGLKIYPPLYFLVLLTLIFKAATNELDWWKIFCDLFFIQNYGSVYWGHTWTLAIEEHFYLSLPWLLIALLYITRNKTAPFQALPKIFIALACALLGLRIYTAWVCPSTTEEAVSFLRNHVFPTHLRIDSLFFGVIISFCYHFHPVQLREWVCRHYVWLVIAAALFIIPSFVWTLGTEPFIHTVGFTLLYLGFGSLLILVMTLGLPRGRVLDRLFRGCGKVGLYSYSIYLWHFPLATVAIP